jgi:hypothetical protein
MLRQPTALDITHGDDQAAAKGVDSGALSLA